MYFKIYYYYIITIIIIIIAIHVLTYKPLIKSKILVNPFPVSQTNATYIVIYYMAVSLKDWELPNSPI